MECDKEMKKIKGEGDDENTQIDRLGNLPDGLIHSILSLMDTKYAVQTCLLSKRWISLWTHLPVFNFSSESFSDSDDFIIFVSHVLDQCKPLNSKVLALCFHLLSGERMELSLLYRIIKFVESYCVEELCLTLRCCLSLSSILFTCNFLRTLRLSCKLGSNSNSKLLIFLPDSLALTSLTTLHLKNVDLFNENDCCDLFSSCLNLQHLVLSESRITISEVFNIVAPQLVSLTLQYLVFFRFGGETRNEIKRHKTFKVVIAAPGLVSFKFKSHDLLLLSVDNSPFLEEVDIHMPVNFRHYKITELEQREYLSTLINMLQGFGMAKSLILSVHMLQLLSCYPHYLEDQLSSPFSNLKSLIVKVVVDYKRRIYPRARGKHRIYSLPASAQMNFQNKRHLYKCPTLQELEDQSSSSGNLDLLLVEVEGRDDYIRIPLQFLRFLLRSSPDAEILLWDSKSR